MLQRGDEIDIWVVEKALGQGGMGSVYRCHNRSAQRILAAIKVLDPNLNRVASAKARFIREAEILFALDHPNIVKVRNVRMDAELPYLEMEFVEGRSVEDVVLRGSTPLEQAIPLMRQGLDALHYMHELGIRHRDIKPSNLLLQDDGRLKIVDFGIATEQQAVTITESGQNFGSVSYAPPEWIEPNDLDPVKWDVYGMGVTFYELLTGRFAFPIGGIGTSRQKALQVMIAKQNHPALDPGAEYPVDLRRLIRRMTDSVITERIASAQQALEELEAMDLQHIDADFDFGDARPQRPTAPTWYPGMEGSGETMVPSPGTMVPDVLEEVSQRVNEVEEEATTPDEAEEVSDPPSRLVTRDGGIPVPVVLGGLALLLLLGLGGWYLSRPAPVVEPQPPRLSEYTVIVTGLPSEVPVSLTLDGQEGQRQGASFLFGPTPGPHTLVAVVGSDCEEEAVWCHRSEQQVEVQAPSFQTPLELAPPTPTPLVVRAPKLQSGMVGVGEELVSIEEGVARFGALLPGRYEVLVGAGKCAEEDRACWPDCPKGCASQLLQVDLPWEGEVELVADLELVAPGKVQGTPTPPVDTTGPDMRAAKAAVTNAQFGAWLGTHPEWLREAALEAGKAEGSYLKGWDGADPPAGKGGQAAVNVSWAAANAFCSSRGGLASVDAQPQTWTEGGGNPWHEFRQAEGKPAWRRSDGNASTAVGWSETGTFIGFRCKR